MPKARKQVPSGVLESKDPPKRRGPEATLKAACIRMLEKSGLVWWRNQSGMIRCLPYKGRAYMMRLGAPGLPDLMLLSRIGQLLCVELKSPVGKLNDDQELFFERVETLQDQWISSPTRKSAPMPIRAFVVRTEAQMASVMTEALNGTELRTTARYEPVSA